MTDRSLDEFAPPSRDARAQTADNDDAVDVDPVAPTMRWAADAVCDACGSPAPRRWRDGDAFVCADCKEW